MTLDDIPEGTTQALTAIMDRLFRLSGCDPTCHACRNVINIGDDFKLAMYRQQRFGSYKHSRDLHPSDVMLCGDCTVEDLARVEVNARRRRTRYLTANPRAGYSRPSKVNNG